MAETDNIELAKKVYDKLCSAIEQREWHFDRDDEKMIVNFEVGGQDIPMRFFIFVDSKRQLVSLISPLPFKMSEGKRVEGAIATCAASYGMCDGSFDYDLKSGAISFRMTASFRSSTVGEGLFQYMISCSCAMVDMYNDKFLAIDKGFLSLENFLSKD